LQDPPKFTQIRIFVLKICNGNPAQRSREKHSLLIANLEAGGHPSLRLTKKGFYNLCAGLPDGGDIFTPKIPIWVNFAGSFNGRRWYILLPFGLLCGQLVYVIAIWSIL
jgi:hypothetical protein